MGSRFAKAFVLCILFARNTYLERFRQLLQIPTHFLAVLSMTNTGSYKFAIAQPLTQKQRDRLIPHQKYNAIAH